MGCQSRASTAGIACGNCGHQWQVQLKQEQAESAAACCKPAAGIGSEAGLVHSSAQRRGIQGFWLDEQHSSDPRA